MTYVYILLSLQHVERYYGGIAADRRAPSEETQCEGGSAHLQVRTVGAQEPTSPFMMKSKRLPSRSISNRLQEGHLPRSGSEKREGQACGFAVRRQHAESVDISDTYARLR